MRTSQNSRSGQAFVGWGDPSCSLHLFHFRLQVAHLCNLFIIQIRCRDPWIVFLFFSKKLAMRNLRKREDRENQQRGVHFQTLHGAGVKKKERTFHHESKKGIQLAAVRWVLRNNVLQCLWWISHPHVMQLKGKYKWTLNRLYFFLKIIMQFEPIHPYISLSDILALFSIVKTLLFQGQVIG